MKNNIQGVGVALVTPFDTRGQVDYEALGRLVDYVTDNGVDYLVALGTTAETPTLTQREKDSVAACIRERNAGRLPLVVGLGGYNTAELIEKIKESDFTGFSAMLSVTPYYNKPTQEGLYRHYEAIAGEAPVPVLLYNVPGRTGTNMTAETTLRIAHEVDNVMGIKEACGTLPQMAHLLKDRPEGFKVISGDDCMAVPLIAIGGDGVISVAANAFPKDFTAMIKAAYDGDRLTCSKIHNRLYEAMETLFVEGNPAGAKAAMAVKGLVGKGVRLPLVEGSAELTRKFESLILRYGL